MPVTWNCIWIDGKGLIEGTEITAIFTNNEHMAGSGGCNRYNADVKIVEQSHERRITISNLTATRMSCGPDIDAQEIKYFSLLESAYYYYIDLVEGNLLICDEYNSIHLKFKPFA